MYREDPEVLLPELHRLCRPPQTFVTFLLHGKEEGRENGRITVCGGGPDMAQDHLRTDVDAFVIEPCVVSTKASEGRAASGQGGRVGATVDRQDVRGDGRERLHS